MKTKLIKIWMDDFQYRMIDTQDNGSIHHLRDAVSAKMEVDPDAYDLILETGSSDKTTTRKLDDAENLERLTTKYRKTPYRIMWLAKGDAGISGPTAVKHEGHISLGSRGIEFRNLPPHWMAIFKSLDEKLRTMGEGAMTQVEMQFLIKECAAVLLSLPSIPQPVAPRPSTPPPPQARSPSPRLSFFSRRPKSVEIKPTETQNAAKDFALQQLEIEVVKLKADKIILEEELSILKQEQTATLQRLPSTQTLVTISDLKTQLNLLHQQLLAEKETTSSLRAENAQLQAQIAVLSVSSPRLPRPCSAIDLSLPSTPSAPNSPSTRELESILPRAPTLSLGGHASAFASAFLPPPPPPPPPSTTATGRSSPLTKEKKSTSNKIKVQEDKRDQLMTSIRQGTRLRSASAPPMPIRDDSTSVVNILARVLLDRRKHIADIADEKVEEKEAESDEDQWEQ